MDVRAKQLLSFNGFSFSVACVLPVSPHVISAVMLLLVFLARKKFKQMENFNAE
jgi:hypothetical protein